MPTVVGLTLEQDGLLHYYTPAHVDVRPGTVVVIECGNGYRLGTVRLGPMEMPAEAMPTALPSILRVATAEDRERDAFNRSLVERAHQAVQEKIEMLGLPMKPVDIEADPSGDRITVYFAAEGRIDFRELVRELTGALSVRVHMHQIGARDHAKILGGIGSCGRELCCKTWMNVFEPVSMRMAKEQSLFLNPSKFSGSCGKLKCCLRYEYDFYAEAHDMAPQLGDEFFTPEGIGHVVDINVVRQAFLVEVPGVGLVEMRLRLTAERMGVHHIGASESNTDDEIPPEPTEH